MDKVVTTKELKAEWLFTDGDTRTFTIRNPKETIAASEIADLEALILNDEQPGVTLLVGDKSGAAFRRINTVVRETKTTMTLDLGLE